ncbi:MAG: LysR family transcriptional regulator, partial [Rhodospirillales bacterium]|nr:LysR family transcriptional regulator [Rhodospirillales bacterium]
HARTLSDFAARLGEDMATLATGGLGRVRLGATPSVIAGAWLAGDLARFGAARPGIAIELREASSLPVLQDLLDGRVDLGIVTTGGVIPAGLQAQPWREDRLLAAMPAGHPLAGRASLRFAELLDHRMIGVLEGGALALLLDSVAEQLGRRQHHSFRVTSTDAARRLVAGGHGICVMPDGLLVPYAAALGLRGVPLAEPWAVRRLRLVSQPPGSLAVPARLLRDHLLAPESP